MGEAKFRARRSATPGTTALSSLLRRTSLHDSHTDCSTTPTSPPADPRGSSMAGPPRFLRRDAATLATVRSLPRNANLVLFTPVVPPPEPDQPSPAERGAVQEPPGKGGRADADAPMDPFEPLGRALSRHHARVRHVPYVPGVGMTRTHQTFLEHAAAVVLVVVCSGDRRSSGGPLEPASGSAFAVQHLEQQQQQSAPYRSPYVLPPLRPSAARPAHPSVKTEPRPSPHQHRQPPSFHPSLKFATQALWAVEEHGTEFRARRAASGSGPSSMPLVLLLVKDDADLEDYLLELQDAGPGIGTGTVLRSGSYSPRALGKVAGMVFGSEV
ncbi:uncharacterized protein LTHEOB_7153 [Neofusicoccum parvum]|nr:uncharacterized protein LTHEOB_7153 [Neofusicoccum parvum]